VQIQCQLVITPRPFMPLSMVQRCKSMLYLHAHKMHKNMGAINLVALSGYVPDTPYITFLLLTKTHLVWAAGCLHSSELCWLLYSNYIWLSSMFQLGSMYLQHICTTPMTFPCDTTKLLPMRSLPRRFSNGYPNLANKRQFFSTI